MSATMTRVLDGLRRDVLYAIGCTSTSDDKLRVTNVIYQLAELARADAHYHKEYGIDPPSAEPMEPAPPIDEG